MTRLIRKFLTNTNNITRDSALWNALGSIAVSSQSIIVLMVLNRTIGLEEAGIFSIAIANANLYLNIGKFGMRNFQASDIKRSFSFRTYRASRLVSCSLMILVSFLYVMLIVSKRGYTSYKTSVLFWMCIFKMLDAVEDVYYGMFQQNGRLDIAAKALFLRQLTASVTLTFFAVISRNLVLAIIISTLISVILLFLLIHLSLLAFSHETEVFQPSKVLILMATCCPQFACSFLSFYTINAPKYAIDSLLSDRLQAIYGFLSMPLMFINLLSGFIFMPLLFKLSVLYVEKKRHEFLHIIGRQLLIIIGITVSCTIAASLIGTQVLSIVFSNNLNDYRLELVILMVGGGLLCLSGILNNVLIVIRHEKTPIFAYGTSAFAAFFLSKFAVARMGLMGAAGLYSGLMLILVLVLTVLCLIALNKEF